MNKETIIMKMARDSGITKAQAANAFNSLLDQIEDALSKGQKVTFVGFGSFSVMRRKERKGRNPQTGETIYIPSKRVVKFSPGKKLKEAVQ
ncbi:MAG: HU family DNA-binding protein [Candidatus Aminicenantia bacterium]